MFVVLKYVSEQVRAARARASGLSSAARSLYARCSTHKLRVARDSGGGRWSLRLATSFGNDLHISTTFCTYHHQVNQSTRACAPRRVILRLSRLSRAALTIQARGPRGEDH